MTYFLTPIFFVIWLAIPLFFLIPTQPIPGIAQTMQEQLTRSLVVWWCCTMGIGLGAGVIITSIKFLVRA